MKKILMILLPLLLAACLEADGAGANDPLVENGFSESERVYTNASTLSGYQNFYGDLDGGISYQYMTDSFSINPTPENIASFVGSRRHLAYGSSLNQYFAKQCIRNVINDNRECVIYIGKKIRVRANGNAPYQLCIRGHNYPGVSAILRINGGAPINLGTSGCTRSMSVINRAFSANTVAVQFGSWPNCTTCTAEEQIYGNEEFRRLNVFFEGRR